MKKKRESLALELNTNTRNDTKKHEYYPHEYYYLRRREDES